MTRNQTTDNDEVKVYRILYRVRCGRLPFVGEFDIKTRKSLETLDFSGIIAKQIQESGSSVVLEKVIDAYLVG